MNSDLFIVTLHNKSTVFVRTESGRIFDITDCKQPITDNKYSINHNGVLSNANQVTPEYVADLLAKGASLVFKERRKAKRRATSKFKRIREEGVYIR